MGVFLLVMMLIPVYVFIIFIPYWTRKTESFGVSIPEKIYQVDDLRQMRRHYVLITSVVGVLTTAIFIVIAKLLTTTTETLTILFSIMLVLFMIISFLVYLFFHAKMKAYKLAAADWSSDETSFVVVDTHFHQQKRAHSNGWFIIPFGLAVVMVIITLMQYQIIPDRIPMQYNFAGEVTHYAEKSYRSVLLMPIMQVYLTSVFLFVNIIIAKAKQQISAANPTKSRKQNVIFRRRWSTYIIVSGTALVLLFSFVQLSFIYAIPQRYAMIGLGVVIAGLLIWPFILSITTGQGGSRVKTADDENSPLTERDDDQYWKLGVFYFNKQDPSLFLEKRFGIGWTNNWAHPLSWILLIVIVGVAVGLPLWLS